MINFHTPETRPFIFLAFSDVIKMAKMVQNRIVDLFQYGNFRGNSQSNWWIQTNEIYCH